MEISVNKFRCSVQQLRLLLTSASTQVDDRVLQQFEELKIYTEKDIESLLRFLGDKILDAAYTEPIAVAFEEFLLLIITAAVRCDEQVEATALAFNDYRRKCIALSKLMRLSTDAKRYATIYFRNKPAPFQHEANVIDATTTTAPKKPKKSKNKENAQHENCSDAPTTLAIIKCCYQLLSADPVFFKELWSWSAFVEQHLASDNATTDELQQLYCNHITATLTNMSATQLRQLNANISSEVLLLFDVEQRAESHPSAITPTTPATTCEDQLITLNFNSELVTNIEGVLLPIFNKENFRFYTHTDGSYDRIVKVDSTKVNLRSIALGIAAAKAICLSGPVGCGKTTLVEYLARKTGRICPKQKEFDEEQQQELQLRQNGKENKSAKRSSKGGKQAENAKEKLATGNKRRADLEALEAALDLNATGVGASTNGFLRIQLGDQTDSKMLLGQYRCTDVPGEFIWLPGVLTQAVMNGYWLLLEDLDSATQDTYTILSSLLEQNFLSVPGFRDCVKIEPGFQLFVTVRTNKSSTNSAQKSLYSLLEKYLYTINIMPLSRNELCKVVSNNYPKLATVANRIVDVFLTFSSGDHSVADNLRQQETGDKADTTEKYHALPFEQISLSSMPNSGRLVSTRDLVKLCQRSDPMFSVTSTECAYFVFQNAVDVFCSYLPQGRDKTKLITSIGAKLGIIQSRCEFFADDYKPEVQVDHERIKVGRAKVMAKSLQTAETTPLLRDDGRVESQALKRQKLDDNVERALLPPLRTSVPTSTFSFTRMASCVLERIAVCVSHAEPVLLVGETGVGKTSSVQYLAERTRHKLVVVNMNNQSDVSDLVGGFKPVDLTYVVAPLRTEFESLFRQTFNQTKNETFLNKFAICYNQGNFAVIIKLMIKVVTSVFEKSERNELRPQDSELLPRWKLLKVKLLKLNTQLSKSINISFAFIPGSLVNCIKNGDWVLLDEINLASAETLECLSTILEPDGSVVLLEKGDFTPVKRHPDFRIFACMNPNTDIGKKDLSVGIRNRFTEFFVDELTTDADLSLLVSDYLSSTGIQKRRVSNIVKLYKELKEKSRLELNDGLGNRPVFSLRTLCRSLRICAKNLCGSIERNLYESFCMSFLTQLEPVSHSVVLELIKKALLNNALAKMPGIPKPGENYLNFEGYWIQEGPKELQECANYILTPSVQNNLKDLARIISIGKLPVLLQGPTSAGKTSLIEYVAKRSGNHCLRINNHEHTDLQEYIGSYASDVTGKLAFKEGVLVQAMRNGYWIILDELNLASTDILEALNRVLDDNRELFIPETQTVVKSHPNFMLFATQNPPGLYGGRKTLSRAFKNRFIELHFSEIPRDELEIILEKRCLIPKSHAGKMVKCMSDLQKKYKTTTKNVFTLRDLFRWGNRYTFADKKLLADQRYDWNQHLIEEGYLVLSSKVRTDIEIQTIDETLYRNFKKRVNLDLLFGVATNTTISEQESCTPVTRDIIEAIRAFKHRTDIVWTRNMTRMAVLTAKALQFNEPVLLVGPTGCGKTTVCQLLASIRDVQLRILNCHMHTEGADFLGGLRPFRQNQDNDDSGQVISTKTKSARKLFEWADGPLIHSMQEGSYFMADEISLAEDSVLERLNCILEPERTVLLAEKGGVAGVDEVANDFIVRAHDGFQFLATMNPGGDFGKKELSPALRNRFTEIWCQASDSKEDLIQIASNCMLEQLKIISSKEQTLKIASYLVEIVLYIRDTVEKFKFSVRDILAWATYIATNAHLSFPEKAIFGLETIFLDALEMLPHESLEKVEFLKADIINFAIKKALHILNEHFSLEDIQQKRGVVVVQENAQFGIQPFFIPTNPDFKSNNDKSFLFDAPTTKRNLFRLLSALSLKKPVLLEGPPGVGKTSIVESIGAAIGYHIVRINLCEHTDLADLFGTDLPAEDNVLGSPATKDAEAIETVANVGSFVWRDGPLLAALKAENTWVLLDELNLAPQSVLEGLNAILDHRGEVYIPELNKTFVLGKETRIFACQNPLKQGGGRKGLPQSFLNRFNKVYLRKLTTEDLLFVVNGKYANYFEKLRMRFVELLQHCDVEQANLFDLYKKALINEPDTIIDGIEPTFDLSNRLVKFSEILDRGIAAMEFGYKGGPFEINLRDILRWCDLLVNPETGFIFKNDSKASGPEVFRQNFEDLLLTLYERMKLVYYQRMRSEQDKTFIRNAFAHVFNCDAEQLNALSEDVALYWTDDKLYLNDIVLKRETDMHALRPFKSKDLVPLLLTSQREILKNIIECVHMEKPVLLCGATDTGKTKLIDALCTLSNQVCNTDTIDDSVTGSFQQIDLNRHLEEISQSVEGVFMTCIQTTILERGSSKVGVAKLMSVWSDYNILAKTKPELNNTTAMSEELLIFRKRINYLNIVIDAILNSSELNTCTHTNLTEQQRLLAVLKNHVRNAESLNTGGSFEWVDSKIVKSLKCGQYIALEHVNLCSSAVLDRLNPVFEPNGNLLISEKGVSANETAEIVEKSENFRAFLTIDPKNGELSRAMRNRCVELALPKDAYDVDDMRMIVHAQGIRDIDAIGCVLEIHDRLVHLTEINNYNISHLTQFAFLTASYKRIGYALERAIYVSAMEVYVYSTNMDLMGFGLTFYQNKLREIVLEETKKFAEVITHVRENEIDHLASIILNCSDLNETSLLRLQMEPLKLLLENSAEIPQKSLTALLRSFENLNFTGVQSEQLVRYFIYILYESSSMADSKLRYLFLQKLLSKQPQLMQMSNSFYACIQQCQQKFDPTLAQLPWNCKLYPRIRDYTAQLIAATNHKAYSLSSLLIIQLLVESIPKERVTKLHQLNALTYSQAVEEKTIIDKLNNGFLKHLSGFLIRLQEVLSAALQHAELDMNCYTQLITGYLWFNRLLTTSQSKLYVNKELNTDLIDKLLLHFKWLDKNLLQLLERILPSYRQLSAEFESSLQKLTNYVLSVKHPLNLIRKVYAKQMTQFQPFYQDEQITFYTQAQYMDQLLGVVPSYGSFPPEYILKKFIAQKLDATKKSRALLLNNSSNENRFDYKFKETKLDHANDAQIPDELKIALQQFMTEVAELDKLAPPAITTLDSAALQAALEEIQQCVNSQDGLVDSEKPRDIDLGMLPLREYYLTKVLLQKFNSGSSKQLGDAINSSYCEEISSLSNATWQLINFTKSPKYQSFHKVWFKLISHLDAINTEGEFEQLFLYLNGCYRNFSSFSRLIWNASFGQQLNNLSTRLSCTKVLKLTTEIDCRYTYEGPSLVNSLAALIFQNDGSLKPVPLNDLDTWKLSMKQLRQLLWHNATIMTPTYSILANNLSTATQNSKKLLHEVKYVQKLCENLENENFSDYNEAFQKLVQTLANEYTKTGTLDQVVPKQASLKYQHLQFHASLLNALIGAIELCLLTFTPLIDPVEKNRLKSAYIVEDINCLSTLTTVYDFMKIVMKYKHFGAEIYEAFEARLFTLREKQLKFSQKVALRPETCLYGNLVQDITHFLKSNCEPQVLHKLIGSAQHSWVSLISDLKPQNSALVLETCTETLNKIELWLANAQRFINHILKRYTNYYQDFLQPLQCSVDQLRFGFEGLKVVLSQLKSGIVINSTTNNYASINEDGKLHTVLANIVEFPTTRTLNIFNVHSSHDILKNRSAIFSLLDKVPGSEHDYFRLLKAKLTELRNLITITSNISEDTFRDFDFALNICNQIWQEEEERRRKKLAEDESLYVSKTKCETEDEELLELQEIEEYFPTNLQDDFGEFMMEDTLEQVMKLDKKKDLKSKYSQVVRDEDYAFLAENFIDVMEQYSHVYYHSPTTTTKADSNQLTFIEPFKDRMQVFVKMVTQYNASLNECLDEDTYNSFGFAVGLQQQLLNEISFNCSQNGQPYNFYKHSNIPEIISCTDVLNRIDERVSVQLELYPEHASLIDIKRVIERIRTLASTSPVVRFNSGFQILRQKVAQWNEVAHKNNHLRKEEIEVAEYVQKWTKLELQFWRNCLSQTYEKVEANAYKYWFFIYNLFQEYMLDHEIDSSLTEIKYTEKRFGDGEILDAVEVEKKCKVVASDIVRILRQFVESASYGDFHVRMRLLQAFELYLHNIDRNSANTLAYEKKNELIAGLRNMQIYFAQFAQEIDEAKKTMRTPIEKKLKEFVKIESYNKDLSYFSMRNNVARVHRNLSKFLKEYKQALQQKITPVFQPKDATVKDYILENDKGRELRYDNKVKYSMVDVKLFVAPQKLREKFAADAADVVEDDTNSSSEPQTLLQKVGKLFSTSRNVAKETVTNAVFPKLINALDVLLYTQLERCEQLRSLSVDRTRERPKQVLEAKQILQQKRKGLTDLFKTLTQLGINYKTGLMEMSLREEFEDFALPPFSIKVMLGAFKDKRLHMNILQLNENLDRYYAKCVFKLKLLQNLMLSPLSELGPPNIERIKGYAIDLFLLVQNQRQLLATTTKNIYELRVTMQNLKEIAEISASESVESKQLEFAKSRDIYLALKHSICRIRYLFEQFSLLLTCVPEQQNEENQVLEGTEILLLQNSPHFCGLAKVCDNVLQLAKITIVDMLKNDKEFLSCDKLSAYQKAHTQLVALIRQVKECFKGSTLGEYLPMAKPITELLVFIEHSTTTMLTTNSLSDETDSAPKHFENIDIELENIVHSVLLTLQKLYKKYPKAPTGNSDDEKSPKKPKSEEQEDDDEALQEHHLKRKLQGELVADWTIMNMPSIINKLSNILVVVKHSPATPEKLNYMRKITSVLPILEQYHLMADYYLFQQLGAHKVSAKMLSVMLTVFVEISTNGFCVPADLMQDEGGQQKKDQKEGEGFGLEDGTGEKDASDKLESEDQLDDAKRPEDRKDEGDKEENDCKEEKGIEMSDDFDGKMQDIEKPENEEDDSDKSEDEEDLNKEMGETEEGADKLDDQIWGDDEEPEQEEEEEEKEMNEEDGSGTKDEKDEHNDLDTKNDAAKTDGQDEHDKDGLDATEEPSSGNEDKRKQQEKDIDNMKDNEEEGEEQTNAYHNELEEPPEPEEMDLGDMNGDNEQEEGDEQQGDENPFDIDKMKDNMQAPEEQGDDAEKSDEEKDEAADEADDSDSDDNGDDAGTEMKEDKNANEEEPQTEDDPNKEETEPETQKRGEVEPELPEEEQAKDTEEKREEKPEEHEQSKDKTSKEENVQSIPETENKGSADQVQNEENDKDVKQDQKLDEQDTGEEKDGVGQAENESNDGGHQGIAETQETVTQEERKNERQTEEKRKQGRTNEERTLGEAEKNKLKQLKTIDKLKEQSNNENEKDDPDEKDVESEEYQHVKDPKNSDKTTLDNATEEQSKKLQHQEDEDKPKNDEDAETNEELMEVDETNDAAKQDDENLEEMSAEKFDQKSEKPSKSEKTNERAETQQEEMEIEGDVVATMTVPRNDDTTAHCITEILLDNSTQAQELSTTETLELRKMYQQQLTTNKATLPQHEDYESWQTISTRMVQNSRELCEQLRLILEPTKCTRLKGDYRTGRRINMKKIIPYIASQFRKDKIWLRRTKPAQRDYKITIAIDDSKSMHHNNSKTLTLEAISLVSQALTLLESGRLSIVSFGESPQIILNHTEQFDGPKLVNSLNFTQNKTKIAELLDFIRTVNAEEGSLGSDNGLFENLLLILSDGRNICSEGKVKVKNSIKLARLQRIFLVYIIIDNPENKDSILDIVSMKTVPVKDKKDGYKTEITSYLDDFPFPYYVIVRDLNQLPLVLSEAMRQWFEMVNSEM